MADRRSASNARRISRRRMRRRECLLHERADLLTDLTLADLGWSEAWAREAEGEDGTPARVSEVRRDHLIALSPGGSAELTTSDGAGQYCVGDWILAHGPRVTLRLSRETEIARRAAGPQAMRQLIAANVDTLAIVTSCNADFNEARLERYLAMAAQAGCVPLIVLTKADGVADATDWVRRAETLSPEVRGIALDARDADAADALAPWCGPGRTLALVGSSGVGKTTLQNHLTGTDEAVRGIREGDARGRHTTTARSLRRTLAGGWLIDTPGMRELALTDAGDGIAAVFADVTDLAAACRFNDCAHEVEPGCAVQAAIAEGTLDPERLVRWRKLVREDRIATEGVAVMRARTRGTGKAARASTKRGRGRGGFGDDFED